ncbi:trehalase family glycosidase [Nonomuraea sp. NPDC005983]|uniref:MGH1-like glycoside hydrolase domain-containing protein n=1 Tax=Nonomuraea sp. NPDC005983 TaxID=3155595 RepID=UPI0033A3B749
MTPQPRGWNTWDVRYHTGYAHLPSGLRIRAGLRAGDGPLMDGFTWRDGLVRLGHHTVHGDYAEVTVHAWETRLELRFAGGDGDVLCLTASVDGPADLVLIVDRMAGVEGDPREWVLGVSHPAETTRVPEAPRPPGETTPPPDGLCLRVATERLDGEPLRVRLTPAVEPQGCEVTVRDAAPGPIDAELGRRRHHALAGRIRTSGWLAEAGDPYQRSVTWNTIYAPDLARVLTPTSRDFVSADRGGFYGTWALHTWDTFFTGLVAAWTDRDYARGIFEQIFDHADEHGMLPNRVSDERGRTADRSQPPVGALSVLAAYLGGGLGEQTRDRSLLERAYPVLSAWHAWWPIARRGTHGLLAWGSDPVEGDPESATTDRARRESGLDDSPMYDDVHLDLATHTMDLADVGLNALHIADADALARIAELLGHMDDTVRLRKEADAARARMDALMWHDGTYRNLYADGRHSPHLSPTMLYPLLAEVPSPERARELAERLLRPEALGGDPPLPSVSREDIGFTDTYWRGRIWAPLAFLAVSGLRRYGLPTRPVVDRLLAMYLGEWARHSHVRENYPTVPGEDVRPLAARSDGLFGWGSLLAHLAFQELADPREDGWRFAHPGHPAVLAGLQLGEGPLTVTADARLRVLLGDDVLLDAPPHLTVTEYSRDAASVTAVVLGGPGELLLAPPPAVGGPPVTIHVPTPDPTPVRLEKGAP